MTHIKQATQDYLIIFRRAATADTLELMAARAKQREPQDMIPIAKAAQLRKMEIKMGVMAA